MAKKSVTKGKLAGTEAGTLGNRKKVKVFISHAKADNSIAESLLKELTDFNRDRVECFLDSRTIEAGVDWRKKLDTFLKEADWLVCIYTGEQTDFCGYEVGVFTGGMALEHEFRDSRVVCLYDVRDFPMLFEGHQNCLVEMLPANTPSDEKKKFYRNSLLFKFFDAFCQYESLYVAKDPTQNENRTAKVIDAVTNITEAFRVTRGDDIIAVTPTQLYFEVTAACKPDGILKEIPESARVKGTYETFKLFGLKPSRLGEEMPSTTWGRVREASKSPYSEQVLWIDRIERDMLNIANGLDLRETEAVFRGEDDKVYRAILNRLTVSRNGTHRFEIILVETLLRQFLGGDSPSRILAFLLVASRFHSLYIENRNRTNAKFDEKLSDSEFQGNYWQFLDDLELMRDEARSLGLLDPATFVEAFGEKNKGATEFFVQAAKKAQQALEAALPPRAVAVDSTNRAKIKDGIMQFLKVTESENTQFLKVAEGAYREELERLLLRPTK